VPALSPLLSSQMNPLPFHLHIWSNQLYINELKNYSNGYYHLEQIFTNEIDLEKESELIPVAHNTTII
jgi:hypothetical protein